MSLTHPALYLHCIRLSTAGCAVGWLAGCSHYCPPRSEERVACLPACLLHSPWSRARLSQRQHCHYHHLLPLTPASTPLHHASERPGEPRTTPPRRQACPQDPSPSFLPRPIPPVTNTALFLALRCRAYQSPARFRPYLDRVRDRLHPPTTIASASVDSIPSLLMSALAWRSPRKKTSATPT